MKNIWNNNAETISQLLKEKGLNTEMMLDKKSWRKKLSELYPRGTEESTQDEDQGEILPPPEHIGE